MFTSLLILLSVTSVDAHAQARVKAQRVEPPEHVVPNLKKVVVGISDKRWASDTVARTLRKRLGYNSKLPAADPGLRSDIVDFVSAPVSAVPSQSEVSAVAQKHNAQGVIRLNADYRLVADERYTTTMTKVVTVNNETKTVNFEAPCLRRVVEVSYDLYLYDGSGHVVTDRSRTLTKSAEDCDTDQNGPDIIDVPTAEQMAAQVVEMGTTRFAFSFIPSWSKVVITLPMDPVVRSAAKAAAAGNIESAATQALHILADDAYNAQAAMIVGAALELNGRAEEAVAVYRLADRFGSTPASQTAVAQAIERASQLRALRDAYGIEPKPWRLSGVDKLVERAQRAAEVEVAGMPASLKGGRNKRHPLFEGPSDSSMILTTVPGNAAIRRLRSDKGFVEVQLPDGETGWLPAKSVN